MVPDAEPPLDPFTIKPPDPESVAMEDMLRRKGMRFGLVMGRLGALGLLSSLLLAVRGTMMSAVYSGAAGMAAMLWGITHYFKVRDRDYS